MNKQTEKREREATAEDVPGKNSKRKRKRPKRRKTQKSREEDLSDESVTSFSVKEGQTGDNPILTCFPRVAKAVGSSWGKFAIQQLGLKADDLMNIQVQHTSSPEQQALKALELWKSRRGRKACMVTLMKALRDGGFQAIADELKQGVDNKGLGVQKPADTPKDTIQQTDARRSIKITKKTKVKNGGHVIPEESRALGRRSGSEGVAVPMEVDKSCVEEVVKAVSDNWDDLARELDFKHNTIKVIGRDQHNQDHRCREVLQKWLADKGSKASLQVLKQALCNIGHRMTAESLQGSEAKRKGEDPDQIISKSSKKPRTKPDPVDEPHETEELVSADTRVEIFYKLVDKCKTIFHKEVLADVTKFEQAVNAFDLHAKAYTSLISDAQNHEMVMAKVTIRNKAIEEIARVQDEIFTDEILEKTETYHHFAICFEKFSARLKEVARGCVLCYLEFEDASCYDTFLSGYRDGRVSETLTQELITDDMRAKGWESLYVHITLLGVNGGRQEESFSDEEHVGGHDKTDVLVPELKAGDPDSDDSTDECNVYSTLLKRSENIFHPGNVRNPDEFESALTAFQEHANVLLGLDKSDSYSEGPRLGISAKLLLKSRADRHVRTVSETLFTEAAFRDLSTYTRVVKCFKVFSACLKRLTRGCLLCHLEFEDTSCYDTFLNGYRDGRLSETLTRELITDDMRAEEGDDLYVHVTLLGVDGGCQDGSLSDEGNLNFL
ncbi:uncharacterized protein LOC144863041 [Branchiostoma floridae x Branchiostoma japonicum]